MRLESTIRERIYRHVLLPPDKRIHPYIKPWYDSTTRNVLPLFLTCKQNHQEALYVLYGKAIFTSPLPKYHTLLYRFLGGFYRAPVSGPSRFYLAPVPGLSQPLRPLVSHVQSNSSILKHHFFCDFLTSFMDVTLHISIDASKVRDLNQEWDDAVSDSKYPFKFGGLHGKKMCRLARFKNVIIHTPKDMPLNADCLSWVTSGVQEEFSHPSGHKRFKWLRRSLVQKEFSSIEDFESDEDGYEQTDWETSEGENHSDSEQNDEENSGGEDEDQHSLDALVDDVQDAGSNPESGGG